MISNIHLNKSTARPLTKRSSYQNRYYNASLTTDINGLGNLVRLLSDYKQLWSTVGAIRDVFCRAQKSRHDTAKDNRQCNAIQCHV